MVYSMENYAYCNSFTCNLFKLIIIFSTKICKFCCDSFPFLKYFCVNYVGAKICRKNQNTHLNHTTSCFSQTTSFLQRLCVTRKSRRVLSRTCWESRSKRLSSSHHSIQSTNFTAARASGLTPTLRTRIRSST